MEDNVIGSTYMNLKKMNYYEAVYNKQITAFSMILTNPDEWYNALIKLNRKQTTELSIKNQKR